MGAAVADHAVEIQQVHRGRADEAGDEGGGGPVVDFLRAAELLDNAVVHHHDFVAHLHGFQLVMRDVDGGGAHAVVQGAEFQRHMFAEFGIQSAQGFVHQKTGGVADDGATKGDALAVAARQAADGLFKDRGDAEDFGDFVDLGADLVALHALADQRVRDVFAHVHMRIEREHLEHEGDVALAGGLLARPRRRR